MHDRQWASWVGGGLAAAALMAVGADRSSASVDASVEQLIAEKLADVPGKELDLLTVEYPPGGASAPHRHDAHVLVYVLQGSIEMQVAGHAKVTLAAGQTFIERPDDVHAVSRNASQTLAAKLLVVALRSSAQPFSRDAGPNGS
jgi:quercetin dioxygenase-like cupin family protein